MSLFNKRCWKKKKDSFIQKNETIPTNIPCTKVNLKGIADLNVRLEAIKLLKETIGGEYLVSFFGPVSVKGNKS